MLSMASPDDSLNATTTAASSFFSIDPFINGTEFIGTNSSNLTSDGFTLDPCHPANALFNCSVDDFLVFARGSKQMPLETTIPITIFFVGIFLTGVIGNLIVCVVIVKHASMHTATNYYLFSLAVSDLLFLMMGLPYDLSLYWHQYPYNLGLAFCKIRALISEASTYVSVLTIVAFSMERFLAICHPLHLYTMSGLQRAVRIIAVLWVISFLSAVPFAVFTKIHYLNYPPTDEQILDSAFCAMLDNPKDFPLWEVSTCVFFVFPMFIMIILYGRMGLKIRSRTRQSAALGVQGSIHGESKQTQSRKAIIRMLAAVVCLFFVCWAPFHAQRLLYLYGQDIEYFKILNQYLFAVSGWLYYVSCTINPILYNVMSHRYRIAFRETLCSRKRWGSSATNGFSRDQSSFRETTVAVAGRDHSESSRLLRVRSMMPSSNRYSIHKDTNRLSSSVRWKDKNDCKRDLKDQLKNDIKLNHIAENVKNGNNSVPSADLVVCIGSNLNGNTKPKCYTTSVTIPTTTVSTTTSANDGQSPQLLNNNSSSIANNNSKLTNLATNKQDNGKINCLKMIEKDCIARIEDANENADKHHLSSSNEFLFNGNNNNSSVGNPVSNKQQQVNQQQQQPLPQQQQHQQNQYQQENILSKFRTETCI